MLRRRTAVVLVEIGLGCKTEGKTEGTEMQPGPPESAEREGAVTLLQCRAQPARADVLLGPEPLHDGAP